MVIYSDLMLLDLVSWPLLESVWMFLGRDRKARIHLTARVYTDICATLLRQAGRPGFFGGIDKHRQQVDGVGG